jgi:4-hydroxybenzoate polyprenyltransferase
MSKTDRIKEEIGWLKVIFGILVATDISLVAWLAQNFSSASRIQVLVSLAAVVVVTGAVVWINRMAYARIKQLEDL